MDTSYHNNPLHGAGALMNIKSVIASNDSFGVMTVRLGFHLHLSHNLPAKEESELRLFVAIEENDCHLFPHEKVNVKNKKVL